MIADKMDPGLRIKVRNTFIQAIEDPADDNDDGDLWRTTSEGGVPRPNALPLALPIRRLSECREHAKDELTDAADAPPDEPSPNIAWETNTPTASPPGSPRIQLPPVLQTLSENLQPMSSATLMSGPQLMQQHLLAAPAKDLVASMQWNRSCGTMSGPSGQESQSNQKLKNVNDSRKLGALNQSKRDTDKVAVAPVPTATTAQLFPMVLPVPVIPATAAAQDVLPPPAGSVMTTPQGPLAMPSGVGMMAAATPGPVTTAGAIAPTIPAMMAPVSGFPAAVSPGMTGTMPIVAAAMPIAAPMVEPMMWNQLMTPAVASNAGASTQGPVGAGQVQAQLPVPVPFVPPGWVMVPANQVAPMAMTTPHLAQASEATESPTSRMMPSAAATHAGTAAVPPAVAPVMPAAGVGMAPFMTAGPTPAAYQMPTPTSGATSSVMMVPVLLPGEDAADGPSARMIVPQTKVLQGANPGTYGNGGDSTPPPPPPPPLPQHSTGYPGPPGDMTRGGQTLLPSFPLTFSNKHCFYEKMAQSGVLSEDARQFTKTRFDGRLSIVTENRVQGRGVHRYLMQFTEGELSSADGVGFVFSTLLPCPKNIQRIVSIFINRAGRICTRARSVIKRSDASVKRLDLGDWIELVVDLNEEVAYCTVWPEDGSRNSRATLAFGQILSGMLEEDARNQGGRWDYQRIQNKKIEDIDICGAGYFGCLVKNEGVTVTLGS